LKILCDADVDRPLVLRLRADGHDVAYMYETRPDAIDDEVLDLAAQTGALLVTRDKGFGQLVFQQHRAHNGVLLIRLAGVPMMQRQELLSLAVAQHGREFAGTFSVLTQHGLRIRPGFFE
jgi:predicted nuclease of predicted toxin-antitoxin system